MQASVTIGRSLNYELEEALLIYRRERSYNKGFTARQSCF